MLPRRPRRWRRRRTARPIPIRRSRGLPSPASQQLPHFLRSVFLVPPDDIRLGHSLESQFVNLHVRPEGDESHQTILGQQIQNLLNAIRQLRQLLDVRAGIDAEDEGRRTRGRNAGKFVFARCELRDQFCGQVRLADVLGVVRGEMIPRQAEWADPQLGSIVDLAVGVQDRMAGGGGAADGVVLEGRGWGAVGRELFEGSVEGADGGDASRGFEARGGPNVEREASACGFFGVGHVPVIALHGEQSLWS